MPRTTKQTDADRAALAVLVKDWRGDLTVPRAAQLLGLSKRTLEGIEQGRGFTFPVLLTLAIQAFKSTPDQSNKAENSINRRREENKMTYFTDQNTDGFSTADLVELNNAMSIVLDGEINAEYVQSIGDIINNLWVDGMTCSDLVAAYHTRRKNLLALQG